MPRSASARTSLRRLSCVCCTTPGHRADRLGRVDAFLDEQRRDEIVDADLVLGDEPPQRGGAPEPAQSPFGERHVPGYRDLADQGVDDAVDRVRVGLDVDAQAALARRRRRHRTDRDDERLTSGTAPTTIAEVRRPSTTT